MIDMGGRASGVGTQLQRHYDVLVHETLAAKEIRHGLKYAFPAEHGEVTRGIPTSYAAEPLKSEVSMSNDLPPVWPWHEGNTRGVGFEPLYKSVPQAALRDSKLYQLLALVDAIRDGRARERKIAERDLVHRLRATDGKP